MSASPHRGADASPGGPDLWRINPLTQCVRTYVSFLKGLFAQLPQGCYRWDPATENSPDQKGSEIFITSDTPVKVDEYVGKRPAIAIVRGPATFQGIGIGDVAHSDLATGGRSRMDIIPTTIFVNVLSRVPLEAENLCWWAGSHIWQLRELLIKGESGMLDTGRRPNYAPTSPAGSLVAPDTEHNWVVSVASFPTYLQHGMHSLPLHSGPGTGIVEEIETVMTALNRAGTPKSPQPPVPLQGSAVLQPRVSVPSSAVGIGGGATGSGVALPPDPEEEAQSTEPLTVTVKT